jgi:glycosyltransferase involved in cell wall biosynthesis
MATYERRELLGRVLNSLSRQRPKVDLLRIVDDCSTDPEIPVMLRYFARKWNESVGPCEVEFKGQNGGASALYNAALDNLFRARKFDHVVMMDSDIVASPDDWPLRLASFLSSHPEIGCVAPDKKGCYLRLHRNGYDEVEWVVSIAYAASRKAYLEVTDSANFREGEWCDPALGTVWDCDICYRLRMLGYRVAVLPSVEVTDLGEGKSTVAGNLARANFEFNRKWNRKLLGRFVYKSRGLFLRWEDYPLNALFRRLLNAQQGSLKVEPADQKLSDHSSELVTSLHCSGNVPKPEDLRKFLDMDVSVLRDVEFGDVPNDLAAGKRQFSPEADLAPFSLR